MYNISVSPEKKNSESYIYMVKKHTLFKMTNISLLFRREIFVYHIFQVTHLKLAFV